MRFFVVPEGRRFLMSLFVALAWLPAACGYHFPGSTPQTESRWQNATLHIVGKGAEQKPQLTFMLRDRLQARLGFNGAVGGTSPGLVVKLFLDPMERSLITEDRAGRANLFRMTLRARPVAEGEKGLPAYPVVHGTASYYEPYISTSVQATQQRAETEAMEQLADTLVAVLSTPFQ
ncbi:MAG: LPS assembly lipoprotein LptE [Magnetococcus sp. MYC-9]